MRLVFVVGLALAACTRTPDEERRDVCNAFCDCATTGPATLEQCIVNDCFPELPTASEPCLQCVYTNSARCSELFDDCMDTCFSQAPRLGGI